MSKLQEKAQAFTKYMVGQMVGDDKLLLEGKEQERHADEQQEKSENDVAEQHGSGRDANAFKPGNAQ
jgi:hypothetical protein